MQSWITTVLASAVTATVAGLAAAVKHLWHRQRAADDGLQALLHDRIFSIYGDCQHKGFASVEDIRNLDYLYAPYHALGGNGTGTELVKRVKEMPVEPAERG
jgi:hypothetical protein